MDFRTGRPIRYAPIPALIALTLMSATKSGAQVVIFDNLTQAVAGVDSSDYNAAAQEFVTGSTALKLTSVTVPLEGPASDTLGLTLYSDNGSNSPGVSLVSLGTAVPTSTTSFMDITVTPASSITLAANTSYWLVGYYAYTVTRKPLVPGRIPLPVAQAASDRLAPTSPPQLTAALPGIPPTLWLTDLMNLRCRVLRTCPNPVPAPFSAAWD